MTPQAATLDREFKGCSVNGSADHKCAVEKVTASTKLDFLNKYPAVVTAITADIIYNLTKGSSNKELLNETFADYYRKLSNDVNPPNWAVLEFTYTHPSSSLISRANLSAGSTRIISLRGNNLYADSTVKGPGSIPLAQLLQDKNVRISKVVREDGFTLQIGERIKYNNVASHLHNKVQAIKGFHTGATGSICMDTDLTNPNGLSVLQNISKVKPLFTAADGVPVYEGQKYFVCVKGGTPGKFDKVSVYPHEGCSMINYDDAEVRSRVFGDRFNAERKFVEVNSNYYMNQLKKDLQQSGIEVQMQVII